MLPTAWFKSDEADLDVGMAAEEEEEEAEEEETPTTASDIPLLFMPIETPLPVVVVAANFGRDLGVDGNRLTGGLSVDDDCPPEKGDERLTVPCSKSCLKENAGNFDDADDDDEVDDDATVTTLDGVVIILSSSSDATDDCPK